MIVGAAVLWAACHLFATFLPRAERRIMTVGLALGVGAIIGLTAAIGNAVAVVSAVT